MALYTGGGDRKGVAKGEDGAHNAKRREGGARGENGKEWQLNAISRESNGSRLETRGSD